MKKRVREESRKMSENEAKKCGHKMSFNLWLMDITSVVVSCWFFLLFCFYVCINAQSGYVLHSYASICTCFSDLEKLCLSLKKCFIVTFLIIIIIFTHGVNPGTFCMGSRYMQNQPTLQSWSDFSHFNE